jgi:hypothetical protein
MSWAARREENTMANYCPRCGAALKSSSAFCPSCGTNVGKVPTQSELQNPPQIVSTPISPSKKPKAKLIIAVIAAVLVVIVAAVALSGGNNSAVNDATQSDDSANQNDYTNNTNDVSPPDNNNNDNNNSNTNPVTPIVDPINNQSDQPQNVSEINVKIVEVEANPPGTDAGNEWVKIRNYGNSTVNITGWRVRSSAGETNTYTLSGTLEANQSLTITFATQFLDNEDETVTLVDKNGNQVDKTPMITDNRGDSWVWVRSGG